LDDWIYWHLIHTTRNYKQYSAIADLHTLKFTVTYALGFSVFTSRILATDLSQSHCHFKSHMKSSLSVLIPFLPLLSIQFNSSVPRLISREAGVSKLDSSLLSCSIDFFFITTLHRPHRKHRLLLSRIVLGVFTAPLHNKNRGAGYIENNLSIVEACLPQALVYQSLPSNGYTRHNNKIVTVY
jgi:hypothetical protein